MLTKQVLPIQNSTTMIQGSTPRSRTLLPATLIKTRQFPMNGTIFHFTVQMAGGLLDHKDQRLMKQGLELLSWLRLASGLISPGPWQWLLIVVDRSSRAPKAVFPPRSKALNCGNSTEQYSTGIRSTPAPQWPEYLLSLPPRLDGPPLPFLIPLWLFTRSPSPSHFPSSKSDSKQTS